MLIPTIGSVQALIRSATCLSWRPSDVFGKTVVSVGLTLLRAASVCMELERVSLAALISLNSLSRVRSSLNEARRELMSDALAPGALLRTNTLAKEVFES